MTATNCPRHGLYIVPNCPGCLFEKLHPEAAAFMDALVKQQAKATETEHRTS